jgi:ferredoxin-type protein NapH
MSRLRTLRRTTQIGFILVIFLLPVFDILRYDASARDLYLFGQVWSLGLKEGFYIDHSLRGAAYVTAKFFLRAILPWLMVLSFFPLLGFLLGRSFCGWLCPEGTMFELADYLNTKIMGRRRPFGGAREAVPAGHRTLYAALALLLLLLVPPLFGSALAGYFIAPRKIWHQMTSLEPSFGLKAAITGAYAYMFVTAVLLRHTFCKYVCAAGLMQMLFGWTSPLSLRIRFDRASFTRCTDCKRCEKVCFMDVKPRSPRRDINCVNCGECITACSRELGGEGLFSLSFGREGGREWTAGYRGSPAEPLPAVSREKMKQKAA